MYKVLCDYHNSICLFNGWDSFGNPLFTTSLLSGRSYRDWSSASNDCDAIKTYFGFNSVAVFSPEDCDINNFFNKLEEVSLCC